MESKIESTSTLTNPDKNTPVFVELKGITKRFPGVCALDNVSINVKRGTIHALVGQNGAGKSTLIKIITGVIRPDKGRILVDGEEIHHLDPWKSQQLGFNATYQDLTLIPDMTVLENVTLGLPLPRRWLFCVNWKSMENQAKSSLQQFGINIDPKTIVSKLTPVTQRMVMLARSLFLKSKLLILDEPTASLSSTEVNRLFELIRLLKANGISVLYISHRLEEVFQIADEVSILRDGEMVGTYKIADLNVEKITSLMVGEKTRETRFFASQPNEECLLSIRNLSGGIVKNVSFDVRKGEILGIAGLVASGRSELLELIIGATKKSDGVIYLKGQAVNFNSPSDAIENKIALLPEDRHRQALFPAMSLKENITLPSLKRLFTIKPTDIIRNRLERRLASEMCDSLSITCRSVEDQVTRLSGGNQQKVVLGRWLLNKPDILIFDEPTLGIDVIAKVEFLNLISKLAQEGSGIIFVSSDLEDVVNISHRILIMVGGEIVAEYDRKDITLEKILNACTNNKNRRDPKEVKMTASN